MNGTIHAPMPPLIIINNAAAKARRAWPTVRRLLESAGVTYESYETTGPGDATVRTRAALRDGVSIIGVVGGDGTLSEAAEGFFEFKQNVEEAPSPVNPSAALAIFPAGTGDDFARGLTGGTRADIGHWTNVFIVHSQHPNNDHTKLIDVLYGVCNGYTQPFICLNASTMGIGGETATRVAAQGKFMRHLSGELRFAAAAFVSIAHWRERRVRVLVDDETLMNGPMNLAAVANALYAGGGMMLSPAARFDDGKLDAVTASGLNRAAVLRELGRIHKGGHVANPKVKIGQGTKARIETFAPEDAMPIEVDGNVRGVTPVEFCVLPKALRFVV
ncbi:MAG TPA: diacylglycerol kinase family protein [Pyrinomonadaceae bacterium]|nr:diacylglycerol kinase family protein [Pyrinomonadaceae bacterium]